MAQSIKSWLKDFMHNCIVHPIMPFIPVDLANQIHDIHGTWAFGTNRFDELDLESRIKEIQEFNKGQADVTRLTLSYLDYTVRVPSVTNGLTNFLLGIIVNRSEDPPVKLYLAGLISVTDRYESLLDIDFEDYHHEY